jgi:S-adenosylmethionine:tRNA ribosyltransferase-isomerase
MRARGVEECLLTLHVGAGTFRPVSAADAAEHSMHAEVLSLLALLASSQCKY